MIPVVFLIIVTSDVCFCWCQQVQQALMRVEWPQELFDQPRSQRRSNSYTRYIFKKFAKMMTSITSRLPKSTSSAEQESPVSQMTRRAKAAAKSRPAGRFGTNWNVESGKHELRFHLPMFNAPKIHAINSKHAIHPPEL